MLHKCRKGGAIIGGSHPGIQPESPDEMALVAKAAFEGDIGQSLVGKKKFFRFFYTAVLQAGMRTHPKPSAGFAIPAVAGSARFGGLTGVPVQK